MRSSERPKVMSGLLTHVLDDEVLVHNPTDNVTYCLDAQAAAILNACDGTRTVAEIRNEANGSLDIPLSADTLWVGIEELRRRGLLNPATVAPTRFDGLSRRAMLRHVGAAAAVPLILSVVADPAAAQSAGCGCFASGNMANLSNPGCSCTGSSDCCGGSCGLSGNLCIAMTTNPGPACCPVVNCPPQNGSGIPPGCGCLGNANCASGTCLGNICSI